MCLDNFSDFSQMRRRKPVVSCEFNGGLKPELRFSGRAVDVYVYAFLFTRKKEEAVTAFAKHSRTHDPTLNIARL